MKKLNLHQVEEQLVSSGLKIFTASDLMVMSGVEKRAAEAFISYNVKKGAFLRLKAGLFSLKNKLPAEYAIANRLYFPSYISLDTAFSYYSLIPETVYAITSVTPKPTREFEVNGIVYDYRRIKRQAFTGYIPKKIHGETVYIATPEKAVADFLYFVSLGKREYNDRLKLSRLDSSQLREYQDLFKT
jgi:predicted transcriptional regulator of viral defense system